jgi:preprotein translocase subunit SecF
MVEFEVPEIDYDRYTNRQLAAVPLAVLGLALLVILAWIVLYGTPVALGFDFAGGTELRVATTDSVEQVQDTFGVQEGAVSPIGDGNEYLIETGSVDGGVLQQRADSAGYTVLQIQERSASFGGDSQRTALIGLAVAFGGMSLLVFGLFRTFVPSIAVVVSAFSDIMIPVALMNLLGIELSLGTVAALLMLIGYSVDSDILLNNHILRRRGEFYESTYNAMQTGVTMTVTSISAMVVMTITARLFAIPLLPDIGLILVFGLTADLMNTYMLNLSLLRWYKFEGVAR